MTYRLRYPSLELNWLPNSVRKGLPTPDVIVTDNEDCGGRYWRQGNYEHDLLGFAPRRRAVIELACIADESTLAHEYRHHWQTHKLGTLDSVRWVLGPSYRDSIVRYFRSSRTEMDALLFQVKHASTDLGLEWLEWLRA
jgi:hypothetical protein